MALDRSRLLKMSCEQLDQLFANSPAGSLPDGESRDSVIACTWFRKVFAWLVHCLFWQGHVFDAKNGAVINRITPFSFRAVKGVLKPGKSLFDQKDCIAIDYTTTSFIARPIRDEIRQVAPGLYLGRVYVWNKTVGYFVATFQYEPEPMFWRRALTVTSLLLLIVLLLAVRRFTSNVPVTYADPVENFKYGSTGGEMGSGLPYSMWVLLPQLFPRYLPGKDFESLGFIYEKDANGKRKDLPVGVSRRKYQGVDRVFLNCAVCHVGTVRDTPQSQPRIVVGMGANTIDLAGFQRFLTACVKDENFNADRIVPEIARAGTEDWLNRQLLGFLALNQMRQRLLLLDQRFSFLTNEPAFGPGRFDTFNPPKVLLNFRMDNLPSEERVGVCDFPSIWYQRQRKGMWLHWDGNNDRVEERNRSASFGTGATPPTLDRKNVKRIEDWLLDAKPLAYPHPIDKGLATSGAPIYAQYCASCHGKSGTDFTGEYVGKVTHIDKIKTDRWRLDSYSQDLCANQNLLYAGYGDERFSHFRKTFGYANAPLDGVWLRAPYLHNGSVPTLRDLLEPAANRPKEFYRGYDVFDQKRVGFISNVPKENDRQFFLYRTAYSEGEPDAGKPIPGNGNFGHEGRAYGTELTAQEKDALVEYLKTF
jgi:hypothetical protein